MAPFVGRTLVVAPQSPIPPNSGGRLYVGQIIHMLAELSDEVLVLSEPPPDDIPDGDQTDAGFPSNVSFGVQVRSLPSFAARTFSLLPYAAVPWASEDNQRQLAAALEQRPDAILLDQLLSTWAFDQVWRHKARNPGTIVVYATHNMERDLHLQLFLAERRSPKLWLKAAMDAFRVAYTHRRVARAADVVTSISTSDRDRHAVLYRPRCSQLLRPVYRNPLVERRKLDERVPRRICVVGTFDWPPKRLNLLAFLREGYAAFERRGIEIRLIGQMEPSFRAEIGRRWPQVVCTGTVPEVQSHMAGCRIGVVPEIVGSGFKWKALDCIFNRLPVFAISRALVDLPLVPGESCESDDDLAALCRAIVAKIDDLDYLDAMQNRAFDACADFLDDQEPLNALREVLEGARRPDSV